MGISELIMPLDEDAPPELHGRHKAYQDLQQAENACERIAGLLCEGRELNAADHGLIATWIVEAEAGLAELRATLGLVKG